MVIGSTESMMGPYKDDSEHHGTCGRALRSLKVGSSSKGTRILAPKTLKHECYSATSDGADSLRVQMPEQNETPHYPLQIPKSL